jgi:hypothetical protein
MDENKRNLQYFEAESMAELYNALQTWQHAKEKRLLSLDIQQDGGKFCCIALTNPTEVIIVDGTHTQGGARVDDHRLDVNTQRGWGR